MNPDALEAALRALRTTDRFETEIRQTLESKGFESKDIDQVTQHLIRRKLLDDRRTTLNLIERKSGRRAIGIEKLRAELLSRGAPEEIVEESLANLSWEDQRRAMRDALSSKFKPTDNRAKAARFLLGRGFAEDEIEGALDEFFLQE
ncbi:MAG: hypothetical protein BGO01_10915 [Armatimonadetes bacterium 55-13]|nr:RecX family transcriptional regulator [Armatimonadota bacterium]OJU62901.1 MAG: hypothetical protein BGO01_10915 [Armatimonadetes bacterium 55-13]